MIKNDLRGKGYSDEEIVAKMPKKKQELAQALNKMADRVAEEIEKGDYTTPDKLEAEINDEE